MLSGWMLGAYTSMLGRLSAATAALEAAGGSNITSDTSSESDRSSYTDLLWVLWKIIFKYILLRYQICDIETLPIELAQCFLKEILINIFRIKGLPQNECYIIVQNQNCQLLSLSSLWVRLLVWTLKLIILWLLKHMPMGINNTFVILIYDEIWKSVNCGKPHIDIGIHYSVVKFDDDPKSANSQGWFRLKMPQICEKPFFETHYILEKFNNKPGPG